MEQFSSQDSWKFVKSSFLISLQLHTIIDGMTQTLYIVRVQRNRIRCCNDPALTHRPLQVDPCLMKFVAWSSLAPYLVQGSNNHKLQWTPIYFLDGRVPFLNSLSQTLNCTPTGGSGRGQHSSKLGGDACPHWTLFFSTRFHLLTPLFLLPHNRLSYNNSQPSLFLIFPLNDLLFFLREKSVKDRKFKVASRTTPSLP